MKVRDIMRPGVLTIVDSDALGNAQRVMSRARIRHLPVTSDGQLVGGDKAKPVVVYCASGARSRKAQQQLEAAGYTNVVNGGGYDDLAP